MAINLKDNEQVRVTFKYGNVARCESRNDDGSYYYAVDTADQGKVDMNAWGAKALKDNWPGRGGSATIVRRSETDWELIEVEPSENSKYPLDMSQWDNDKSKYMTVPWMTPGVGGEGEQSPGPTPVGTPTAASTTNPPAPSGYDYSLQDLGDLMRQCFEESSLIIMAHRESTLLTGDEIGAAERMAVALFIDAKRAGLKVEKPEDPAEKATREAGEQMLGAHGITQAGPQVSMAPDEEPPLQQQAPPEEEDGLNF